MVVNRSHHTVTIDALSGAKARVQPREDPIARRRCDPRARVIVLAIYEIERDLAPASIQSDSAACSWLDRCNLSRCSSPSTDSEAFSLDVPRHPRTAVWLRNINSPKP